MLWFFGRTSNQQRMKQVKRRVQAGLPNCGCSWMSPQSLRAQKPVRRQPELSRPCSASDAVDDRSGRPAAGSPGVLYDRAPLTPASALVTMGMQIDSLVASPVLPHRQASRSGPAAWQRRGVSWRVMPMSPVSKNLVFRFNGQEVSKRSGRRQQRYVPGKKAVGLGFDTLARRAGSIRTSGGWSVTRMPGCACSVFTNWLVVFCGSMVAASPEEAFWRSDLVMEKCSNVDQTE
jgi:hypothetical protein